MVATFRPYLIMLAAPVDVGHAARNHCIYLRPNSASLPVLFTLTKARPCRSPRWALISLCIIDSGARPPDLPLIHGRRSARSFAHAKRNSRSASVQANSIPTLCHAAPAGLACQMHDQEYHTPTREGERKQVQTRGAVPGRGSEKYLQYWNSQGMTKEVIFTFVWFALVGAWEPRP
ncbi:hypothetical protein C8Q72DRAFT_460812 [Fomitopsis betulina]|nr:hypothetical protein C8Q72DRAFT_460812 [Fomitopsis betulina]